MATLVTDCPRCLSKSVTFDVKSEVFLYKQYEWKHWYETFCICRHCHRSTVFILSLTEINLDTFLEENYLHQQNDSLNDYMMVEGFVNLTHISSTEPPEYLPEIIDSSFKEATACLTNQCFNAAATMFRLCIDLATKPLLPENNENGLTSQIRRNLGLRLPWLFEHNILPSDLRELSTCVKEDGNDGAHSGTLKKEDAEDLLDFTYEFLERLYTEPMRLQLAKKRRQLRRSTNA